MTVKRRVTSSIVHILPILPSSLQDPRVQGLCLIDPVDNSSFGPQGVGYPSALPALQAVAKKRQLPVLVVGAALNTDVVPVEANWRRFTAAAAAGRAPVWEVVLNGSNHLQFLDKQMPLFSMFSNSGPTPDATVREITQVCPEAYLLLVALHGAICIGCCVLLDAVALHGDSCSYALWLSISDIISNAGMQLLQARPH